MTALVLVAAVTTLLAGVILAAGISLAARTTRSPVAWLICRLALGIRTDDLDAYLARLFEEHARAHPDEPGPTLESYRRTLRTAGLGIAGLGVLIGGFVAYAVRVLLGQLG